VNGLSDQVWRIIRDRRLFKPGQQILVAVSGGLDSMVLLHVMNELVRREGWKLTVAHLNHRLRGKSSDADARLVQRIAQQLGLAAIIGWANVREIARREKLSVEMAARKARHEFLVRTAARLRIRTVALAHHADDQVELFFLRLFRGSGSQGLLGMQWRNPSPFNKRIQLVRPLLGQTRARLAKYAKENRVRFREDASNRALDIQRNRIRHELLPLLRKRYQPALDTVIARVLDITQAEAEVITETAHSYLSALPGFERRSRVASVSLESDPSPRPSPLRKGRGGSVRGPFEELASRKDRNAKQRISKSSRNVTIFGNLPVAVQRRSLQLQLFGLGIAADFDLIEQLRLKEDRAVCVSRDKVGASWHCSRNAAFMRQHGVQRRYLPDKSGVPFAFSIRSGGSAKMHPDKVGSSRRIGEPFVISRDSRGLVRVGKGQPRTFLDSSVLLNLGSGSGKAIFEGIQVNWERKAGKNHKLPKKATNCEWFDADRVTRKILLRHWRPGDRFQPIGMSSAIKLQDFFTNQQVPRERRHQLVLAVSADNEVFWVEGMRISERFKLTKSTNRRLQWRWQRL
jgi:tRNA(Ile)-lysidine synthetase-like protein